AFETHSKRHNRQSLFSQLHCKLVALEQTVDIQVYQVKFLRILKDLSLDELVVDRIPRRCFQKAEAFPLLILVLVPVVVVMQPRLRAPEATEDLDSLRIVILWEHH